MILEIGEKIHVMVRRNFETDLRRHFIGEVTAISGLMVRVEGNVYVLNMGTSEYIQRPSKRVRLFGLADSGNIINVLPSESDLANAVYTYTKDGRLVVTDKQTFSLDINEFSTNQ